MLRSNGERQAKHFAGENILYSQGQHAWSLVTMAFIHYDFLVYQSSCDYEAWAIYHLYGI